MLDVDFIALGAVGLEAVVVQERLHRLGRDGGDGDLVPSVLHAWKRVLNKYY